MIKEISKEELDRIETLLKSASEGKSWKIRENNRASLEDADVGEIIEELWYSKGIECVRATYIAAIFPHVALALIDEIRVRDRALDMMSRDIANEHDSGFKEPHVDAPKLVQEYIAAARDELESK